MDQWLRPTRFFLAAIALSLATITAPASAGSQLPQGLADLAREAGTIFEGRVIAEQARWVDNGNAIATYVTFEVDEVLKGERQSQTVTLRFLGGEIEGVRMEISGLERPVVGEHGVYFVADDAENLFHPLSGGGQGHFLVVDVDSQQRILTGDARPVATGTPEAVKGSMPTAAGIATLGADQVRNAVDLTTFKSLISRLARDA